MPQPKFKIGEIIQYCEWKEQIDKNKFLSRNMNYLVSEFLEVIDVYKDKHSGMRMVSVKPLQRTAAYTHLNYPEMWFKSIHRRDGLL